MKRLLMIFAALAVCQGVAAQFSIPPEQTPRISRTQPSQEDILSALESVGLKMYVFSLPVDSLKPYNAVFYLDEYDAGTLKNLHTLPMGKTYFWLTNDSGGLESVLSDKIRIIINGVDRDKPRLDFGLAENATVSIGAEHKSDMNYGSRPFEMQSFEPSVKIPLVMYGSFWQDGEITRFCGSNELDAGMQNEMFRLSPHYYIVGVEFIPAD